MADVDFSDKRFRSKFETELKKLQQALKDCDETDEELTQMIADFKATMNRTRGATSMVVRLTEQMVANRNQRLSIIGKIHALKKDVIEREIKLADKAALQEASAASGGSGAISPDMLSKLQLMLIVPGGCNITLEPYNADELLNQRIEEKEKPVTAEDLPTDFNVGDIVSDPEGNLWEVGAEEVIDLEDTAALVVMEPEGEDVPPYAKLKDGTLVLVAEIG